MKEVEDEALLCGKGRSPRVYLMDLLQTEEARMRLDRKRSLEIEIEVVLEMGEGLLWPWLLGPAPARLLGWTLDCLVFEQKTLD